MKKAGLIPLATVLLVSLISVSCGHAATAPATAWTRTFGGSYDDCAYSVRQTSDGGYIIVGETYSYGAGNPDVWLIKTDASGNVAWNRTFGGSDTEYAESVQQTSDGGYIILGLTYSSGTGDYDVWLVKVTA